VCPECASKEEEKKILERGSEDTPGLKVKKFKKHRDRYQSFMLICRGTENKPFSTMRRITTIPFELRVLRGFRVA
jgi:hypothetical protein